MELLLQQNVQRIIGLKITEVFDIKATCFIFDRIGLLKMMVRWWGKL
jgi:hypothetical protein